MTNTEGNENLESGGIDFTPIAGFLAEVAANTGTDAQALADALVNADILKMGPEKFAARSTAAQKLSTADPGSFTVAPLNPERGWVRPELAAKTLAWVADCKPSLFRRVNTRRLPRRQYDSVMDLVANGLVERRDHVGGKFDGLVTLRLTELGTARLVESIQLARAVVTGLTD